MGHIWRHGRRRYIQIWGGGSDEWMPMKEISEAASAARRLLARSVGPAAGMGSAAASRAMLYKQADDASEPGVSAKTIQCPDRIIEEGWS